MWVYLGKTNEIFPHDKVRGTILVTIRRLDQEGRAYFYLEHPVKINGRVRKYSKYLGKAIPENVEELKKQFLFEISSSMIISGISPEILGSTVCFTFLDSRKSAKMKIMRL